MNRNRERAMAWASWVRRVRAQGLRIQPMEWDAGGVPPRCWVAVGSFAGVIVGWYSPVSRLASAGVRVAS